MSGATDVRDEVQTAPLRVPAAAVCGAIGRVDAELLERLRSLCGADPRPLVATSTGVLHATGGVTPWRRDEVRGWTWGQAVRPPDELRGWADLVTRSWGRAGFAVEADGTSVLHADGSGIVPLFVARVDGGSLVFSSSLDALARALPGPLHVDRDAWGELLAAHMVMSDRTPFAEIERLGPGRVLSSAPDGRLRSQRIERPVDDRPRMPDPETTYELLHHLREALRRVEGDELTLPLSGGWDSRLLAVLAARDGRTTETVTATDEFAREEEHDLAREVAGLLGLPHRSLAPVDDWWPTVEATALRTHHLTTLHHWMSPLGAAVAQLPGTVLDGLAGDVLLKNRVPDAFAADEGPRAVDAVRKTLAARTRPVELLAPSLAARVDDHVTAVVDAEAERLRGHPARLNLLVFHLRTVRGIGLAPACVVGAHAPVVTPFLANEVLALASQVPTWEKRAGSWYRAILATAHPTVAAVRSTRDRPVQRQRQRRPDLAPSVVAATRDALSREELRTAIGPRLRWRLDTGRVLDPNHAAHMRVVRGLVFYSLWVARYGHLLVDPVLHPSASSPGTAPVRAAAAPDPVAAVEDLDDLWLRDQAVAPVAVLSSATDVPPVDRTPRRAVLLPGPWRTAAGLRATLARARELAATDGRIAVSHAVTAGAGRALSSADVVAALASELELLHVEVKEGRLRAVGTPREGSVEGSASVSVPPHVAPALIGALETELERARQDAARAVEDQRRAEHRLSAARGKLRRMRQRRSWRLVTAVGDARGSLRGLLRLPVAVVRVFRGNR